MQNGKSTIVWLYIVMLTLSKINRQLQSPIKVSDMLSFNDQFCRASFNMAKGMQSSIENDKFSAKETLRDLIFTCDISDHYVD